MKRWLLVLAAAIVLAAPAFAQDGIDGKPSPAPSSFRRMGGSDGATDRAARFDGSGNLGVFNNPLAPGQLTVALGLTVSASTFLSDSSNTTHGVAFDKGDLYRYKTVALKWSGVNAGGADSSVVFRLLVSDDGIVYRPYLMRRPPTVGTTYVAPSMAAEKQLAPDTLQWVFRHNDLTSGDSRDGVAFALADPYTMQPIMNPWQKVAVLNRCSATVTYTVTFGYQAQ